MEMIALFRKRHPEVVSHVAPTDKGFIGYKGRRLLSILNKTQAGAGARLTCSTRTSFSGRTASARFRGTTSIIRLCSMWAAQEYKVQYLPGESNTGMFGGNSNWRGPVWMPVNALLIRALLNLYSFYGDEFKVECPTGSGQYMTLFEVAKELSRRLAATFLREPELTAPARTGRFTAARRSSRTIRTGAI